MKTKALCLSVLALLALSVAQAGEAGKGDECPMPAVKNSPELEKMKSLAGTWTGTGKQANAKEESITVKYRVTSGGSAVEETIWPGQPQEMISMYHDRNGKLTMTHYCVLGNQPEMELASKANGKLVLQASAQTKKELAGQMYMSGLTLEQTAQDTLIQTGQGTDAQGKTTECGVTTLKRVNEAKS